MCKIFYKKNHKLKSENLKAPRSNQGILIDNWHKVIGKTAKKDLATITEIYRKDIF